MMNGFSLCFDREFFTGDIWLRFGFFVDKGREGEMLRSFSNLMIKTRSQIRDPVSIYIQHQAIVDPFDILRSAVITTYSPDINIACFINSFLHTIIETDQHTYRIRKKSSTQGDACHRLSVTLSFPALVTAVRKSEASVIT
ncbi:hypothetical protein OCU04_006516 [Sclerotinia nivalis]|uniref:Uncharacterized protein n=1 Tax=Sclerotinia nivalis TaxID=352851 RepID=A0A9X0AKU4_9HELO|nr:hypothetical protein OCU04_006516 [Sclerotinia nivalis]